MMTLKRDVFGETVDIWIAHFGFCMDEEEAALVEEFFRWSGLKPKSDARVLDLGCGLGKYSTFFTDMKLRYVGIDKSETIIKEAKGFYPDTHFQVMDIGELKFPNETFDLVWAMNSLSFLPRSTLPDVLSKIWKVMKSGGTARLTTKEGVGDDQLACFGLPDKLTHRSKYSRQEFQTLAKKAGFERQHYRNHVGYHYLTVVKD
jgi:SAM-dependent methyltransferase